MLKVISLFSLLDDDFTLGEGTLYFYPFLNGGGSYNAYGGSYYMPIIFISKYPDF